jgi:hypothetical protein
MAACPGDRAFGVARDGRRLAGNAEEKRHGAAGCLTGGSRGGRKRLAAGRGKLRGTCFYG